MMIGKSASFAFAHNGAPMAACVSSCSWLNPDGGLHLRVILGNGFAILHNKEVPFSAATEATCLALIEKVRTIPCSSCKRPAFDPSTVDTNRGGKCEECFLAEEVKSTKVIMSDFRESQRQVDFEMKKVGFTHRVAAWKDSTDGSGFEGIDIYMVNPTSNDVQSKLALENAYPEDFLIVIL